MYSQEEMAICDIDGTLRHGERIVSEEIRKPILSAQERLAISLATGRNFPITATILGGNLDMVSHEWMGKDGVLVVEGGGVVAKKDGTAHWYRSLHPDSIRHVSEALNGAKPGFITIVSPTDPSDSHLWIDQDLADEGVLQCIGSAYNNFHYGKIEEAYKLIHKISPARVFIGGIFDTSGFMGHPGANIGDYGVEYCSADKMQGIEVLCDYFGVDLSRIIFAGDSINGNDGPVLRNPKVRSIVVGDYEPTEIPENCVQVDSPEELARLIGEYPNGDWARYFPEAS